MKFLKTFFSTVVLLIVPMFMFAGPPDPCTDPFDPCPIDSGLLVLIGAGIVIAAAKSFHRLKMKPAVKS